MLRRAITAIANGKCPHQSQHIGTTEQLLDRGHNVVADRSRHHTRRCYRYRFATDTGSTGEPSAERPALVVKCTRIDPTPRTSQLKIISRPLPWNNQGQLGVCMNVPTHVNDPSAIETTRCNPCGKANTPTLWKRPDPGQVPNLPFGQTHRSTKGCGYLIRQPLSQQHPAQREPNGKRGHDARGCSIPEVPDERLHHHCRKRQGQIRQPAETGNKDDPQSCRSQNQVQTCSRKTTSMFICLADSVRDRS